MFLESCDFKKTKRMKFRFNHNKKIVMVEKSNKIYISRFIRISIYILKNLNLYRCFDCLDKLNGRSTEPKIYKY